MSSETSTREGLCVYCGTARPVTKPICPQCGRTWIDTKIGEDLPPLTPEIVAASKAEREALAADSAAEHAASERTRLPWGLLVGAAIGIAAIVTAIAVLGGGDDGDAPVAGSPVTTTQASTTDAPGTTADTTTTAPTTITSTTSTTPPTTTTTTTTTIPPIEAEGSPIPLEELTLGAFALGPLRFDTGAYLGRLVASLGQPDARTEAGIDLGLCPDEQGTAYTWGALTAIFRLDDDQEILVGYRLDETGTDHPTQQIASRSGLRLGDTIERISAIYLQSGLALESIDGTPSYLLLRSGDDLTLLWGPATGLNSSDVVQGIYSPRSCDGGPQPSV